MTKQHIIGLVGYVGSGKTSLGDMLTSMHGWTSVAFAKSIKEMLLAIDPAYAGRLKWLEESKRESTKSTRYKLQRLGSYMRLHVDDEYWVKRAMEQAFGPFEERLSSVVFTDVRHFNEATRIRQIGGRVVAIVRAGCVAFNDHETERNIQSLMQHAEITLTNDSDIPTLCTDLLKALE